MKEPIREMDNLELSSLEAVPFYRQPQVQMEEIPIGPGVPLGITHVSSPRLGIGGAYGAWGFDYDNSSLVDYIEQTIGRPLSAEERMDLLTLGFAHRHHVPMMSEEEHLELELRVGERFLREAAAANGWDPEEVEGVLIGASGPVVEDYVEQIAERAGIPDQALKVSIHKACDSSVSGLHLTLNPDLPENNQTDVNLARELSGKKVLVGGIEGLSRFVVSSRDVIAMQLFGNAGGVIGVIPGVTMGFLAGAADEVFDEKGVLAAHMYYPHSRQKVEGKSLVEVTREKLHHIRVAGMMHEPENDIPIAMAGPMGMVKLFVRSGVDVVRRAYDAYQEMLREKGLLDRSIKVTIMHHANYKINKLKAIQLSKLGINLSMPWLLSEFGNVSAASNMIAFLRKLPDLLPGDHVLFDGFGAGTYYDVLAVEMKGA
jgi:hypothetical protein